MIDTKPTAKGHAPPTSQIPTIVETHGLSKRFGSGTLAVDGVDMSVRHGEVYGFLGPNGAGKTTTLKMLVGLIGATSGTARVACHVPNTTHASLIEDQGDAAMAS